MDNWLSQTFQPLLQQYVANYSKEQVKVNFLKGKGLMRHVVLNVDELNARLPPDTECPLRFARVAMDQVAFKASLTRIKTQPVTIYVEHIDVDVYEQVSRPYSSSSSSSSTRRPPASGGSSSSSSTDTPPPPPSTNTTPPPPRPYKLQQRILDGIRIEVKEVRLRLRTLGRRKCGRAGEWNPPDGLWVFRDLTLLSVDEEGLEGNLEDCWRFNKERLARAERRSRPTDYFLFKQLRVGSLSFFLLPRGNGSSSSSSSSSSSQQPLLLVEETPFTCDFVVRRLLHDVNVVLGVEVDVRIDRFKMKLGQREGSYQQWLAFFVGF